MSEGVVKREPLVVLKPDAAHLYTARAHGLCELVNVGFDRLNHAVAITTSGGVIAQAVVRIDAFIVTPGSDSAGPPLAF